MLLYAFLLLRHRLIMHQLQPTLVDILVARYKVDVARLPKCPPTVPVLKRRPAPKAVAAAAATASQPAGGWLSIFFVS
jgi:hypothetical protein